MPDNCRPFVNVVFPLLLLLVADLPMFGQARLQSQTSGSWNSSSTWQLISGSDPNGIPDANDTVDIASGDAVTVAANSVNCATLNVHAGASLLISGAGDVRINGDPGTAAIDGGVTMSAAGRLTRRGTGIRILILGSGSCMTISGNASNPTFDVYTFHPASTFAYTALGQQSILSGVVFGNLTLGGSGKKTVTPMPADTAFRCSGKLIVAPGAHFDVSTNVLHIQLDGDVENSGTIDASAGITVLQMRGAHWVNNGTYLPSTTPSRGYTPTTTFTNTEISGSPVAQSFYDLVIEGTTNALSNLIVYHHITISEGATLHGGAGLTHEVSGNWRNYGTFNPGSSTVVFKGTVGDTVTASAFYNVVVAAPGTVFLTGDVSVIPGGTFTITSGGVSTGQHTLAVHSTEPTSLLLGANKIIGTVSRDIAPGSTGIYRFFSEHAFVAPGGVGNPATITATVYPGTNPPHLPLGADTNMIAKRYYSVTASGAGVGFAYTMRLPYDESEIRGQETEYVLWRDGGSGWVNVGSVEPANTANNYVEQTALTEFSNWALAEKNAPLPVQLSSITVAMIANTRDVRLDWSTVSETNNYGFFIQRSAADPGVFADLAQNFVPGSGTTLEPKQYTWLDRNVPEGRYRYRLKQVDLDGSYSFSDPVEITISAVTSVSDGQVPERFSLEQNYPNPFNPATQIRFSVEKTGAATLKVYNILGDEVGTCFVGMTQAGIEYRVTFDGTALSNGAYFYRLTSGGKTAFKKMVLLR